MLENEIIPAETTLPAPMQNDGFMVQSSQNDNLNLTSQQKAAIVLASMGPEFAGPVVEKISDENMKRFITALRELREVPREKILAVIADFIVEMNGRQGLLKAGPGKAMEIAQGILDGERFERLTSGVKRRDPVKSGIWGEIELKPTQSIGVFLQTQKPEVAAFILSKLPNDIVGDVLMDLPEETSLVYVSKISEGLSFAPFVEKAIEQIIRTEFLEVSEEASDDTAISYVADILSVLDREKREHILQGIEGEDKERAQKIKDEMLTFDDLPERLPPTAVQIIFKEFDKKALDRMLKAGAMSAPAVPEYFYANISQRLAGSIREGVEAMEPLEEKDAAKAMAELMAFIGKLLSDERITLIKKEKPIIPSLDVE